MTRFLKFSGFLLICSLLVSGSLGGCSPKPNSEEIGKLEQARTSAEGAEKKLHELRQIRIALESELEGKQSEFQNTQQENKDLK